MVDNLGKTSGISLRGVTRSYGRAVALHPLDLDIGPGELVGLIGPNGAGKTTLLRILTAQLLPSAGSVSLGGVDVVQDPGLARARVGIVPEEPALYEYLSAREMLQYVMALRGGGDLDAALQMAGLGADAERLIHEYSQGMRRRTALAAAVVSAPPVLVLDEALNGLDPENAMRVETFLAARAAAGTTILLSTHLLDSVERMATRVLMMRAGRVVADARVAELGPDGVRALFREKMLEGG